jgi:hypothetical protein
MARGDGSSSDAWRSMVGYRRRLVLQLVAGQGPFWQLVAEAREMHNIEPKTEVPPADFFSRSKLSYPNDVYRIRDAVIPEVYYRIFAFDWLGFIAACLLYQPPRQEMDEFASFAPGPYAYTFVAPGLRAAESPRMIAPPIKEFRDADGGFRYAILPDEHSTEADERKARWKIASIRKKASKGGAPKRDPFIAVQCAIWYDEDNPPDQSDRRKRRWTHAKLAEEFGLKSGRAAKDHIELGRAILQKKVPLQ